MSIIKLCSSFHRSGKTAVVGLSMIAAVFYRHGSLKAFLYRSKNVSGDVVMNDNRMENFGFYNELGNEIKMKWCVNQILTWVVVLLSGNYKYVATIGTILLPQLPGKKAGRKYYNQCRIIQIYLMEDFRQTLGFNKRSDECFQAGKPVFRPYAMDRN